MRPFLKKYAGFFLLFAGIVGLGWWNISEAKAEVRPEVVTTTSTTQITTDFISTTSPTVTLISTAKQVTTVRQMIVVDVKGEVLYPGVYRLPMDARLIDAIDTAGGLTEWADVTDVNQAEVLLDEMVIRIPRISSGIPEEDSMPDDYFVVDIQGEIVNPGVYWLPKGSRIIDVIQSAGGASRNADLSGLNRAELISDGMMIVIPEISRDIRVEIQGEILRPGLYLLKETDTLRQLINKAGGFTAYAKIDGLALDRMLWMGCQVVIPRLDPVSPVIEPGEPEPIPEAPSEAGPFLININTATLEELMMLTGIGIILGQRIIDYRAENGDFQAIEDIMRVSGIKDSVFSKIQDEITVDDR